jgi:NAD(P)-dependent dehydrogenase (short-subunit alcohol dehydrogenase family)
MPGRQGSPGALTAPATWPGLSGRVALVTGGARNMGRAFAIGLAGAGAHVAIIDLPGQEADARAVIGLIERVGRHGLFVPADIRDAAAIERAVAAVEGSLGPVRVLINNAALTSDDESPTLDYPIAALDGQLEVTLRGTFVVSQVVARRMAAAGLGGSIVNIASRVGVQVQSGGLGYGIAKAAVTHMTRIMALDLAPHGIRVNAIGPGSVPRPESGLSGPGVDRYPLGRVLAYDDIVGTALYLASDASAMVTAQVVIVDGGLGLSPAY